jgi:hypothetical protein
MSGGVAMLVCGVELTANEAIICLLGYDRDAFSVPACRVRLFTGPKPPTTQALREFHFSFNKLMEDYQVDEVVILERALKGKLAGSAMSFKLETAIQLIDMPVTLINLATVKAQMQRNPMQASVESLGLKKFQAQALSAAYAYQHECLYK